MERSTDPGRGRAVVRERLRSLAELVTVGSASRKNVRLAAGLVALSGLASLTSLRVALNAPVVLPRAAFGVWFDAVTTAAVVAPAAGAVALGVTADEAWARTGLILAGVFGCLSAVTASVAVPATGAILAGGSLPLVGVVGRLPTRRQYRDVVVAVALLTGLALSLYGAYGVRPSLLRPAGTTVALVGMAATPLAFRAGPSAYGVGGLAAGLVYHLTGAAPFVSGAVSLVAGSVVGAPALLLAVAIGGLTATVTAGALTRRADPTLVGLLLLAAGVPSSLPRALGVVLAVAFLVVTVSDQRGDYL